MVVSDTSLLSLWVLSFFTCHSFEKLVFLLLSFIIIFWTFYVPVVYKFKNLLVAAILVERNHSVDIRYLFISCSELRVSIKNYINIPNGQA